MRAQHITGDQIDFTIQQRTEFPGQRGDRIKVPVAIVSERAFIELNQQVDIARPVRFPSGV